MQLPSNSRSQKQNSFRNSHTATATKSPGKRIDQTQQLTPPRFQKKQSTKLSHLKNSLNKCIQQLSNKKQMNRQALQQIRDVNKQIIQSLGENRNTNGNTNRSHKREESNPSYITDYNERYHNSYDNRDQVALSTFHLGTPNTQEVAISNFHISEVYRPISENSVQLEQLKSKIRHQRDQNQSLQSQIAALRRGQQSLRFSGSSDNSLQIENQRLREQLNRLNSANGYDGYKLYDQFQILKEDNQRLRKETINLLKNGR